MFPFFSFSKIFIKDMTDIIKHIRQQIAQIPCSYLFSLLSSSNKNQVPYFTMHVSFDRLKLDTAADAVIKNYNKIILIPLLGE